MKLLIASDSSSNQYAQNLRTLGLFKTIKHIDIPKIQELFTDGGEQMAQLREKRKQSIGWDISKKSDPRVFDPDKFYQTTIVGSEKGITTNNLRSFLTNFIHDNHHLGYYWAGLISLPLLVEHRSYQMKHIGKRSDLMDSIMEKKSEIAKYQMLEDHQSEIDRLMELKAQEEEDILDLVDNIPKQIVMPLSVYAVQTGQSVLASTHGLSVESFGKIWVHEWFHMIIRQNDNHQHLDDNDHCIHLSEDLQSNTTNYSCLMIELVDQSTIDLANGLCADCKTIAENEMLTIKDFYF